MSWFVFDPVEAFQRFNFLSLLNVASLNVVLSCTCAAICVSRIQNMAGSTTRLIYRIGYAAVFALVALGGSSPLWLGDKIGWGLVSVTIALLILLLTTHGAWKNGHIPAAAKTAPGDFDDEPSVSWANTRPPEHFR